MHLVTRLLTAFLCFGFLPCQSSAFGNNQIIFDGKESTASTSQHKALIEAEIIPDVLDDFNPSISVTLAYPSKHKAVELGNSIKPKHVTSQPIFQLSSTDTAPTPTHKDNATYVLVLTDPDATSPSEPIKAQMCHWIAANITLPPDSSKIVDVSEFSPMTSKYDAAQVNEIVPYFPPTPPPKTGYHRYVFVVLASSSGENHSHLKKPKDRPHWGYGKVGAGVREWADENDLTVVGKSMLAKYLHCWPPQGIVNWRQLNLELLNADVLKVPTSSILKTRNSDRLKQGEVY
ncbi:hypothetical protein ACLMJK_002621 [Lecanora helva]